MDLKGDIKDLVPDARNFNRHSEYGMRLLEKSVRMFGMGRSILVDRNNNIIAGNGVAETAGSIGIERVRFIDTDGSEIIAVRRKDIDLDSPVGREMALADNATSSADLEWDMETIEATVGQEIAEDWGLEWKEEGEKEEKEETTVEVRCKNGEEALLLCGKLTDEGYDCKVK